MSRFDPAESDEAEAVYRHLMRNLGAGEVMEVGMLEKALSSPRVVRVALREEVGRLRELLADALSRVPPPPPPPLPRPHLVRDDASRVDSVLAVDPSRSSPAADSSSLAFPKADPSLGIGELCE